MLNKLKEMKDSTSIYTLLGPSSRKFPKKFLCVHGVNKFFKNLSN